MITIHPWGASCIVTARMSVAAFIFIGDLFTNIIRHADKSIYWLTKPTATFTIPCTRAPLAPRVWGARLLGLTLHHVNMTQIVNNDYFTHNFLPDVVMIAIQQILS